MASIKKVIKDPSFYFKLIELGLCIAATIIYASKYEHHFALDRSTDIAIAVAVPNSIITVSMLIIMVMVDQKDDMTELCLNGAAGALNVCLGTLLLCYVNGNSSAVYLILSILCVAIGVLMLIDCVRLIKSGAVDI